MKPGDVTLDIDVTSAIRKRSGNYRASFQFNRGQHALEIRSVALLRDGVEICRDTHPGLAGGRHEDNTYQLTLPDARKGGLILRATVAGMAGTDSHGDIRISSTPPPSGNSAAGSGGAARQ